MIRPRALLIEAATASRAPSGDQVGEYSSAKPSVMLCAPLVVHVPGGGSQVTSIRYTWRTPVLRSVAKAMRVPSGDQAGSVSSPAASVRFARPVPSALITPTPSPVVSDGAPERDRSPPGGQPGG